MEILGQLVGGYHLPSRRHNNISHLLICTLSVLGLLSRLVECRHRDADTAQLGQQQNHHSSQPASSGGVLSSSDDDGKCEFRILPIRFRPLNKFACEFAVPFNCIYKISFLMCKTTNLSHSAFQQCYYYYILSLCVRF